MLAKVDHWIIILFVLILRTFNKKCIMIEEGTCLVQCRMAGKKNTTLAVFCG
jgi:hypothetical protein